MQIEQVSPSAHDLNVAFNCFLGGGTLDELESYFPSVGVLDPQAKQEAGVAS